jgi:hypothetical protein
MTDYNRALVTPQQNERSSPALIFHDGQCMLDMTTEGGTRVQKLISMEAVKAAAQGIPIDSGWLPLEGTGIVRWGNGVLDEWLVAYIAPKRHRLELIDTPGPDEIVEHIVAPLPGLVIFGGGCRYWIWAVKDEHLNPQREIFRCPLPNVTQDASICWGPLKPPQASPRTIMRAFGLFIGSSFNNHAANEKSKKFPEDCRLMLKELADPAQSAEGPIHGPGLKYPVDDLTRQTPNGISLDAAIRGFFETGGFPG